MRPVLKAYGDQDRTVWLADSFRDFHIRIRRGTLRIQVTRIINSLLI
jgi:hypothetical protein